jgi:GH15 family glucan-1,4-alpha-glucosidase
MVLNATILLEPANGDVVQAFRLKAGDTAFFTFGEDSEEARRQLDGLLIQKKFEETSLFWRKWVEQCRYSGRWRETVVSSALVLKLLTDDEHGSLIAAATFGLPEQIGGARNWDYRFTWLRDSAFTLYAMMRLGFVEEADAFRRWIDSRLVFNGSSGPLQVLYRSNGGRVQEEVELSHLAGYKNSRPVRIGNAAQDQLQLDVYGELMDTLYLVTKLDSSSWPRRFLLIRSSTGGCPNCTACL